jgi:hypothetical protein
MEKFVNTFIGGLDKDTAPTKYDNTHYFDLENFRVISDDSDGLASGNLVNTPGTSASFTIPNTGTLLGWVVSRSDLIIITTCGETNPDRIYKIPIDELEEAQNIVLTDTYYFNGTYAVYDDGGTNKCDSLIYKSDLGFSETYPIKDIVANYENSSVHKIYWTDGYNNLYHLNIVNNDDTNPLESLDVDRLRILPEHTYGTIDLELGTGGILKSGRVQYAYQLYSVNGTETMFSPASGMFNLTSAEYPSSDTNRFGGSEPEENTNKCVNITISLESDYSDFSKIRIVALDYQAYGNVPTVRIVTEMSIASDTIYAVDYGYQIGELALEEFQILRNNFIPQTLVNKNNYLLAGNITEEWFDVDQLYLDTYTAGAGVMNFLDTRAYRWAWKASGTTTNGSETLDETTDPVAAANGNDYPTLANGNTYLNTAGDWQIYIEVDAEDLANPVGGAVLNFVFTEIVTSSVGNLQPSLTIDIDGGTDTAVLDLSGLSSTTYSDYLGSHYIIIQGTGYLPGSEPSANYTGTASTIVVDEMMYTYNYTYTSVANTPECAVNQDSSDKIIIDSGSGPDYTLVPEEDDCYNAYNDISNDDTSGYQYKYQEIVAAPATADLGGTGPFISYEFATDTFDLGTQYTDTSFPYWKPDADSDAYDNPEVVYEEVGYARDEVYRFGIVFYDTYGRSSFVKWIADIRTPNWEELNYMASAGNGSKLAVKFTIDWDELPTDFKSEISGFRIVRVNREDNDKTIKGMGFINPTFKYDSGNIHYSSFCLIDIDRYDADDDTPPEFEVAGDAKSDGMNQDLVDFVCPEVVFNKNMSMSENGFLEFLGNLDFPGILDDHHTLVDDNEDTTWVFYYDDATIHTFSTNTRSEFRAGSDEWLLTTPEFKDPPAHTIDSIPYYNRTSDFYNNDSSFGFKGTAMLINLDITSTLDTSKFNAGGIYEGILGVYRVPLGTSIYGGNTFENRSVNTYIPCGEFIAKDTSGGTQDTTTYGGDTYISMFSYLYAFIDEEEDTGDSRKSIQSLIQFPVETSINLNYRSDLLTNYFTNPTGAAAADVPLYYLSEVESIGISQFPTTYPENVGNLYRYNNAYSAYDMSHQYMPKPFGFSDTIVEDTKVMSSQLKTPNEYSDSWLKFSLANHLILDTQYGGITRILHKDNRVISFQPQAISFLSVLEREVVQTQNTSTLGLGTGGVLQRYDYISTTSGSSIHKGIIPTDLGLYYVDDYNCSIRRITDKIESLSDTKGLKSYFENNTIDDAITGYDAANREVLFYIEDGNSDIDSSVIVFNGFTDTFTGFYTYVPKDFIWFRKTLLSNPDSLVLSDSAFHKHNEGNYASYYGASADDSTITLIINPRQHEVVRFDLMKWLSVSLNASEVEQLTDTFSTLQAYTSYQYTGALDIETDTANALSRRFREWRYNNIRHYNTNGGKLSAADNGRFRDTYMKVKLTYDNSDNNTFKLGDVTTYYFPTKLR